MIYLITDTHFYHKNIIKYESRPENFNELIIENVKKVLTPTDTLYHMGDVIFSQNSKLESILASWNCKKILIRGNHDEGHSDNWFLKKGFDEVCEEKVLLYNDRKYLSLLWLSDRPILLRRPFPLSNVS